MENKIHLKERPPIEELSKRIQDLEDSHARLKHQMFKFMISKTSNSISTCGLTHNLTESDYFNILQSIDQPIHITNSNRCIIFRNQAWENFYGYTAAEIHEKSLLDLVIDSNDLSIANGILKQMLKGECWTGEFPVRNNKGERFVVSGSTNPFRDENGRIIGVVSVTAAPRQYQQIRLCEPTRVLASDHNKHYSRSGSSFFWDWLQRDQEHEYGVRMRAEVEKQSWMVNTKCVGYDNKALGMWALYNYSVKWEDLMIREMIGRGSCGTLYHAVWQGSVSLMKRLRHPNILLFMGTATSPQRICIVTEFLSRGTLFKLLHRNRARLDWRRRIRMAIDIARGINYLHHCLPPIIHRDLNSSILLVDKDWTVKVGDFGLCRTKHETSVTRKEGIIRPQWMAPEVLRNEQSTDERSDVYSYGVVLWEITTKKIPWEGLNSMEVMEAVGMMNQGLDIPKDVDPQWASLIQRCLCSEPQSRPTFQEILEELHDFHMRFKLMSPLYEDKRVVRNCKCETDT